MIVTRYPTLYHYRRRPLSGVRRRERYRETLREQWSAWELVLLGVAIGAGGLALAATVLGWWSR